MVAVKPIYFYNVIKKTKSIHSNLFCYVVNFTAKNVTGISCGKKRYACVDQFCNAGFDLLGNFTSVVPLQNDPLIIATLTGLIICGSMGFVVFVELLNKPFTHTKMTLHTKLVLLATGILLFGGAAAFAVLEWNNPGTLGGMTVGNKLLNSLFQSTTCRTAGFCAVDQLALTDSSKLIACVLMFIGASPASTGGGVKTTTFSMLLLLMATVISGREALKIQKLICAIYDSGRTGEKIVFD